MVAVGPNSATGSLLSDVTDDDLGGGGGGGLFLRVKLNASSSDISADTAGGGGTTDPDNLEAHTPELSFCLKTSKVRGSFSSRSSSSRSLMTI